MDLKDWLACCEPESLFISHKCICIWSKRLVANYLCKLFHRLSSFDLELVGLLCSTQVSVIEVTVCTREAIQSGAAEVGFHYGSVQTHLFSPEQCYVTKEKAEQHTRWLLGLKSSLDAQCILYFDRLISVQLLFWGHSGVLSESAGIQMCNQAPLTSRSLSDLFVESSAS